MLVFRHDAQLVSKSAKSSQGVHTVDSSGSQPLPTQQFGVTLQFIKERNNGEVIPPVVRQCVDYLSQPDGNYYQIFITSRNTNEIFYSSRNGRLV